MNTIKFRREKTRLYAAKKRAVAKTGAKLLLLIVVSTLVFVKTFPTEAQSNVSFDLYGGAVNNNQTSLVYTYVSPEYGPNWQFVAPYGGQGPNAPMDLVLPQSLVYLWANLTYNLFPVASKEVAFEIDEPNGQVYTESSAITDENGVAGVTFRMPWSDNQTNVKSLLGVWKVTATVSVSDVVYTDVMQFEYDYLLQIWKVTTDAYQYNLGSTVIITYTYGSYAMQTYSVLFVNTLVDNESFTVGTANVSTTVGNATAAFNQFSNQSATVTIQIPQWAHAGLATVYTDCYDKEPTAGGVPVTPEYVGPTIEIVISIPEYPVTFAQTGLDSTAIGTVVTVSGASEEFADLPFTVLVDNGSSLNYSYSTVVSSTAGKRFTLTNVIGPSSPLTVNGPVNVTGDYKIQYQVTFSQSGVNSDFLGTLVTIDDVNYSVSSLPVSFWWDSGSSHSFVFESPLVVSATKSYVWNGTSGLSSLQSGTLTVSSSGNITGNYAVRTVVPSVFMVQLWLFLVFSMALGVIGAIVLLFLVAMYRRPRRRRKPARGSYTVIVHPHI